MGKGFERASRGENGLAASPSRKALGATSRTSPLRGAGLPFPIGPASPCLPGDPVPPQGAAASHKRPARSAASWGPSDRNRRDGAALAKPCNAR